VALMPNTRFSLTFHCNPLIDYYPSFTTPLTALSTRTGKRMIELNVEQRKYLKAQAHALKPVVMIGNHGLSDAVIKEAECAIAAHELIKIRVLDAERDARETYLAKLCDTLHAAPVQHIGKLLLIYRPALKPKLQLP
jgi:RNA-binding protein